jgi:F-type H+-transporting ATPase subunit b
MPDPSLLTPALTLAAEGGSKPTAIYAIQFLTALIAFGITLAILGKFAWPKILGALDARDEKIRSEIRSAEEARERADAALKEYEASLAEARAEANEMIERTKAEQTRLAAELRAESEREAQKLVEEARRNIASAKQAAVEEVYREAAKAATAVAAKILEREVNADDQQRLVDDAVSTFAGAN